MSLKYLIAGQLKFMKAKGFDVMMVSADGPELPAVIDFEGCDHYVIPMTRKISPIADIICLLKFVRLFRQQRPHIIHTHTPKAGLMGMLAGWLCRVPIRVHTLAGWRLLNVPGWRGRLIYIIEKITFWAAHEVWPNSRSLRDYLHETNFVSDSKLHVIGNGSSNGIDLVEYSNSSLEPDQLREVKRQIEYDPEFTYLLFVGRIVTEKGIEELVRVFGRLGQKHPLLRLLLVGPREDHIDPIARETIDAIANDKAIIETGFSDDIKYFMAFADVLVHPSHREGFPNVPLQAGAMKCPIVCSNIGGNIDIVEHESTGLLFDVRNEGDMFDKLERAICGTPDMKNMAEKLHLQVEKNFERSHVHQSMYDEYQRLIRDRLS